LFLETTAIGDKPWVTVHLRALAGIVGIAMKRLAVDLIFDDGNADYRTSRMKRAGYYSTTPMAWPMVASATTHR
jgi:hypothetical protein